MALAEGAALVTTHAGLYRIDIATSEAVNVIPNDYFFRVSSGHGAAWITTGSDGHVLRIDPASNSVTAEIEVHEGPVTELAMSKDAVWVSATSDLVRIDPITNEVVARLRSQLGFGDIAYGESGLWVIAGAGSEGEVWQIDPGTNEVAQRFPLANPSFWNEIAVGDDAVWVTSSPTVHQAGTALVHLYRIDPSTGDITGDIPLGHGQPSELGQGEGAVSNSGLALDDGARQESDSADRQSKADPVVHRRKQRAPWDELITDTTRIDARQGDSSDHAGSRDDVGEGEHNASLHAYPPITRSRAVTRCVESET